jgi:hypothetical protein
MPVVFDCFEGKSFEQICEFCNTSGLNLTMDEYNNLYQLSFSEDTDLSMPLARSMNGIIFEKETNVIVHYSPPKAYDCFFKPEPGMLCMEKDPYTLDFNEDDVKIELFTEGTLIRVFWYDGAWQFGTSRMINAALSHWSSDKSFRELFLETLKFQEEDLDFLDPQYCYSYIIQHPENRIVLDIRAPFCICVNRVNLDTLEVEYFTDGYRVDKSLSQVLSEVHDDNCPITTNYIAILPDQTRVKITNRKYSVIKKAMNNNPSIRWVYIEAIKNGTWNTIKDAFPSEEETFNDIDTAFQETVELIHIYYYRRNIKRDTDFEVPKRYERTVAQLHGQFRKTREPITKELVNKKLLDLDTKLLYYVLAI